MARMARFSARSPPRLSRCRTVWPLLAGTGLVPARAANAASLRHRPGWPGLSGFGSGLVLGGDGGFGLVGLGAVTGRHICDGSCQPRTGF